MCHPCILPVRRCQVDLARFLSPLAGLVGSAVAFLLNGRRIGPIAAPVLIALSSAFAVGLWVATNGGLADEDGFLKSIQWIATWACSQRQWLSSATRLPERHS